MELIFDKSLIIYYCNLQLHIKTTGCAESSLCPKCSVENETPNYHIGIVGNYKLYQSFVLNILESPKPLFTM